MLKLRWDNRFFKFECGMGFLLLVLLLVACMIRAGFWQMDRAEHKKRLQQGYDAALRAPVREVETGLPEATAVTFQRVSIVGSYIDERQFLLENRYRMQADGLRQIGYEVLTPFQLQSGELMLVNRGWVPATIDRNKLPDVPVDKSKREIAGTIAVPERGFRLGSMTSDQRWPRRLLYIDFQQIGDLLEQPLYPAVLMLDAGQADAYRAEWEPVIVGPVKHYAYALQWFLMALTSTILFAIFTIRRHKDE